MVPIGPVETYRNKVPRLDFVEGTEMRAQQEGEVRAEAGLRGPQLPEFCSLPCWWVLRIIMYFGGYWQLVLLILVGKASLSCLQGLPLLE